MSEYGKYTTRKPGPLFSYFLLYKGGTYKELSKKQLEMKLLLQRAHEATEATKLFSEDST